MSRDNLGKWLVLHTKPRREQEVERILSGRGIETYLPALLVKHKGHKQMAKKPFFPCYLFARVDLSCTGLSYIVWTPGLTNVVSFDEKIVRVPDEVIEFIRQRLAALQSSGCDDLPRFEPEEAVRITSGPLHDLEAVFDRRMSGTDRALVLLNVLGRMTACEVELEQLEWASRR
jgi:transcription elongation factor/antiterminator RfaH